MKRIKKVILWAIAILLLLFMIASFFVDSVYSTSKIDLILYRISSFSLFAIFEAGVIFELNLFHIQEKSLFVNIIKKTGLHILFWIFLLFLSIGSFSAIQSFISKDFKSAQSGSIQAEKEAQKTVNTEQVQVEQKLEKEEETKEQAQETQAKSVEQENVFSWKTLLENKDRYKQVLMLVGENFHEGEINDMFRKNLSSDEIVLIEDLFDYCDSHGELPKELQETFTEFCSGDEYEDMFFEDDNAFYNAVSKGFEISWKSDGTYYIDLYDSEEEEETEPELIEKEPVRFDFDDEYIVGDVEVHISEIQIRQEAFKVGSKIVEFRIFLDIINNTSSPQFFTATKTGNIVGVYYDSDESRIGGMENLVWDEEDYIVTTGTTIPANTHKEIVVQAGAITTEPVYYGDEIQFDIFLRNNDAIVTVSFTCNL